MPGRRSPPVAEYPTLPQARMCRQCNGLRQALLIWGLVIVSARRVFQNGVARRPWIWELQQPVYRNVSTTLRHIFFKDLISDFMRRGPAPDTPGICFGMTRVFKVLLVGRLLLSGETEANSAGTQLVEG